MTKPVIASTVHGSPDYLASALDRAVVLERAEVAVQPLVSELSQFETLLTRDTRLASRVTRISTSMTAATLIGGALLYWAFASSDPALASAAVAVFAAGAMISLLSALVSERHRKRLEFELEVLHQYLETRSELLKEVDQRRHVVDPG